MNHRHITEQFRGIALIAEKDMRIYYTKPPVLMFGFLFPMFIFLAFFFGREADVRAIPRAIGDVRVLYRLFGWPPDYPLGEACRDL
ncbi:MAG: hypothetical protein WCI87_09210 [Euryarchaeota archaeon]